MASSIITSSPLFLTHHHHAPNPIKKTSRGISMLANRDSQNTSSSLIRSIKIQKVFEDKSRGIVCYIDDKGEITCEGFDEGPRLHQGVSRFSCYQRVNQDILDLLNRSWHQVIDDGKLN